MATILNKHTEIAKGYYIAKKKLLSLGYFNEIEWQYNVSLSGVDEYTFLKESAWVVLSSGMRESVIRKHFKNISSAFFDWKSSENIVRNSAACTSSALHYFNNKKKINAIVEIAEYVSSRGIINIIEKCKNDGIESLQCLPFIGPVTSLHLAKNIGFSVAKPDRHLLRIANSFGYGCVQKLCEDISSMTDEPVPVVDLVLWRYATINYRNVDRFAGFVSRN